ncbi:MAG: SAM-dependent methyltransferase [Longimicrobiales bacterium]|jgi:cyclopropane-fatty-acyl-phospholipid synthase
MMGEFGIELAERGLVPLPGLRMGVRGLVRQRLRDATTGPDVATFAAMLAESPLALAPDKANEQHYEVPSEFFELALGPRLKYSGAYWPPGVSTLEEAETAMLERTCDRAQLCDGQDILELGCGWGSLTLYMAEAFPNSRITAVSNSAPQRRFIEARAPKNVRVITADMNDLSLAQSFDRVVSVEMFEHMRNYRELLRRVHGWLRPDGRLFVHIFCHKTFAYPYDSEGSDNWMGRYFFTGGIMPSFDFFSHFEEDLAVEVDWQLDGTHYARTARAWRENIERQRDEVIAVFRGSYGGDAERWFQRWRLFFLACEELFGFREGSEWIVGHYRLAPVQP